MNLPEDQFTRRVWTMQIIAATLIGGVVILAAIALFLVDADGPMAPPAAPGDWPIVSIVSLAVLAICAPLSIFISHMVLLGMVQRIAATGPTATGAGEPDPLARDEVTLLGVRQMTMIMSFAWLEGAGTMAGIAYMLEAQSFALTTAMVAVAFMLFQFPTQGRIRVWLERHVLLVHELRQLTT
jgi:hypothetical protein